MSITRFSQSLFEAFPPTIHLGPATQWNKGPFKYMLHLGDQRNNPCLTLLRNSVTREGSKMTKTNVTYLLIGPKICSEDH